MRRFGRVGVVALVAAGALAVGPVPAGAVDATFQALAVADGVRVTVFYPNAPLTPPGGNIMDFGGPVAEALLDSIGQSTAYASFPFPGAGPGTSPALIRGASGGALPVPDYPLFAQTKAPANPKQEFGSGPLSVKAESGDKFSAGTASVGGDAGGGNAVGLSKATARVESAADAITSTATSEMAALAVGPLRIGRVFSTAKVSFGPDGRLQRSADTVVEGVSVDGQGAVLTHKGRPDLSSLNQGLSGAGITVELVPQQEVATGIVAPAVQVTQKDASGGKIVYRIGSSSAFVDATLPSGSPGAGGGTTAVSAADPQEAAIPTQAVAPALAAAGGLAQRLVPGNETPSAKARPAVPAATLPASDGGEMVLASSVPEGMDPTSERGRLFFHQGDAGPLFLILLAGAALAVGTVGLGRLRGARG